MPSYSRHVGQGSLHALVFPLSQTSLTQLLPPALKFLSPNVAPPVPWQRVISSAGTISSRGPGTDGAQRQRDALEAEGVEVQVGRTGEFKVDFGTWGWFPDPDTIDIGLAPPEDDAGDA